jgi:hypothetical protein
MNSRIALQLLVFGVSLAAGDARAGYTHYWNWKGEPAPDKLRACLDDMRRIVAARREILAVYDEEQTDIVHFNAAAEDAEDFQFPRKFPEWVRAKMPKQFQDAHFCKTAGKPFDEVVTACLIAARYWFPVEVLEISSDGEWPEDWAPGAALYAKVTGRAAVNPLSGLNVRPGSASASKADVKETSGLRARRGWPLVLVLVVVLLLLLRRRQ